MLTQADFEKWAAEHVDPNKPQHIEQDTQRKFVGVAMSNVKTDPRWKLYADHLEGLRARLEDIRHGVTEKILDTNETDIIPLKLELRFITGRLRGMNDAIRFIEVLIDQGENAAKRLEEEDDGTHGPNEEQAFQQAESGGKPENG
jgi:hypothetical protein